MGQSRTQRSMQANESVCTTPGRAFSADVSRRLGDVHQMLDRLDTHIDTLSSTSTLNMQRMDRKLDALSVRLQPLAVFGSEFIEGGLQSEGSKDRAQHGACAGLWRGGSGSLPTVVDSEDSTRLPRLTGERLALDPPVWDSYQPEAPPEPTLPPDDGPLTFEYIDDLKLEGDDDDPLWNAQLAGLSPKLSGHTSGSKARDTTTAITRSSFKSLDDLKLKAEANTTFLGRLWHFLDDADSGKAAMVYASAMPYIIVTSVLLAILQTGTPPVFEGLSATLLNVMFESVFLGELLLRGISCPSKKAFLQDYNNTIDVMVVVPLFIRMCVGFRPMEGSSCGDLCTVLMCVTPLLRALKTLRRFEKLPLLIEAFEKASEGLPVCIFVQFVLVLFFGPLLYLVEPRENIETIGQSMWLTIVTMTTVGYGDITPCTTIGSLIVSFLVILSVLYMAIPIGIVGFAFSEVWQERDFILLRHRTKAKFAVWGYQPHDVPALFSLFAEDGSGELDLSEFKTMLTEMRIGLKENKIVRLFEALDEDDGGSVDDREFVKQVFPDAYRMLYEREGLAKSPSEFGPGLTESNASTD